VARTDVISEDVDSGPETPASHQTRLKWTIVALFVLMAGALLLKALDERQTSDAAALSLLGSETRALASQINARADAVDVALELIDGSDVSRSTVATTLPNVDAIVALTDASRAPEGSRLKDAAEAAAAAVEEGHRLALSRSNDIVLVSSSETPEAALLALAPAGTWLPTLSAGNRLSLIGDVSISAGDPAMSQYLRGSLSHAPAMKMGGGLNRAATACSPLSGSAVSLCTASASPLFTLNDVMRLLIYALLLAAPVLAIVGLMGTLTKEETIEIIEETRDNESDRIMNVVMRGARAGYWEWKPDEQTFYLSEGAAQLFNIVGTGEVSIEELLMNIHPDHQARMRETLEKSQRVGWIQTNFLVNASPARWLELRGSVSGGDDGEELVFGGILLDVTRRRQSEDRVKAAERRLRNAIEGFNGPFALWDNRQRILYWNRAFAIDFGLTDTVRPGMSKETIVIARAGAVRAEKQSAEDSRTMLIALNNGRWVKMVERATPDGGLISIGVDVTENVRNEQELKKQKQRMKKAVTDLERSEGRAGELARKYSEEKAKAERMAHTKSAFLANMSHELRTPLNAINGFSEILANELYGTLGDQRYKGYAQDILTSGQHLLDMINDILDMAKIEAGKMTIAPQPIDPVDPVDAAVRMIRRKAEDKQIKLVLEAPDHLPDIDADHRAIRQMVLNLISNAIKFTDADGTITVGVERRGPDIFVSVADTGIGIPAEDVPRLAMPFEQVSGTKDRNYNGTGLGLALTKSFAEMHGGRMSITSVEGEGTTVGFTLPIEGATATVAAAEEADRKALELEERMA
jgi:two-component system cell cycle sensor histidine kinase PleC